jgi:predicted CXXCH cytochrome family protein
MEILSSLLKERRNRFVSSLMISLTIVALAAAGMIQSTVAAAPVSAGPTNDYCLGCHQQENMSVTLKSGGVLALTIDSGAFKAGVHGQNDVACVACHVEISTFPHPERTVDSLREVALAYYTSCKQCHAENYEKQLDSVHQRAIAGGNNSAAVCSDCHNPHTQKPIAEMSRVEIPEKCAQCHDAIFNKYKESVHGSALIGEGNPDVPTCIDCHGVHNIQSPETAEFRLNTPALCARCHTNAELMDKYDISTNVLNTYVADFHGATVTMLREQSADLETLKPVCTDCHGVHDIVRPDDPVKGIAVKENLLARCQRCHPDATTSFSSAWTSHYIPDAEKNPLVYYVNLFYKFLIPTVLGGMAIFVVTDFIRRMIERFGKKGTAHS